MNEFKQKKPAKYIVFQCTKCNQYTYAKVSQKGKKCPRCRQNHVVADLHGEIVEGATQAMQLVKQHQNNGFPIAQFKSTNKSITLSFDDPLTGKSMTIDHFSDSLVSKLLSRILDWQKNEQISSHEGFPEYVVEYIAREIEPDSTQRAILIRKLHKLEKITRLANGNVMVKDL